MNRNLYRRTWLKLHRSYEKKVYRIFIKDIRQAVLDIPFDSLTEQNYRTLIELNIPENGFFKTYSRAYTIIGMLHGKRIGAGINRDMKSFNADVFATAYRRFLGGWLRNVAPVRIKTVRNTLVQFLLDLIGDDIEEGKDIRQIARDIHKLVRSRGFYRWQALRIARTETTAAANLGATIAGRDTGVVLEKEWISSNDSRTRTHPDDKYDHIEMDFVKVAEFAKFDVQGDRILFPGDPDGKPSNIINCRCTVALVPKRNSEGRLVFKS